MASNCCIACEINSTVCDGEDDDEPEEGEEEDGDLCKRERLVLMGEERGVESQLADDAPLPLAAANARNDCCRTGIFMGDAMPVLVVVME